MSGAPRIPAWRRILRPTAFRIGLVLGVMAIGLPAYLLFGLPYGPKLNIEVVSNGADVSRHGGAKLTVETDHRGLLLTQTCSGACDDLRFQFDSGGEDGMKLGVYTAAGAPVVASGGYLDSGIDIAPQRYTISGVTKLEVASDQLDNNGKAIVVRTPAD